MAEARAERQDFRVRSRSATWALERVRILAPLALRWTLGPMLLAHGIQKAVALGATATGFEQMGFSPGALWAPLVMLAELVGGAALILGLFTRVFALINLISQLTALLVVHLPQGFFISPERTGIEFTLVNSGGLLALLILGAGTISIDHLLRRRNDRLETRRMASPEPRTSTTGATTTGPSRTTDTTGATRDYSGPDSRR